jgi:uncharacterized protein (DUF2252 family)
MTSTVVRPEPESAPSTPTVPTVDDRVERGRAARTAAPRSGHGEFTPAPARPDPIALLGDEDATRVPELLPIRYGRMAVSPFTFYRGAAAVMASDLAGTPSSGLTVQLCGDAHLSNFGFFGSPERRLVFDLNDFDETLPGPWEWDVKRLAASVEIAGRDRGFAAEDRRAAVEAAARGYRVAMREFAEMTNLDVWYSHADVEHIRDRYLQDLKPSRRKRMDRNLAKIRTRDNMGALARFATVENGTARLVAEPPLVMPFRDLLDDDARRETEAGLMRLLDGYRESLQADRRVLFDAYRVVDIARKVVGVGSVGTRSFMILLLGRTDQDALFLQAKEAGQSVLEAYCGQAAQPNAGQRVVEGQRLMQAVSDIFLGWQRTSGIDGRARDFYVRQLRDWKGSVDVEEILLPQGLQIYARLCGWTLARAHARSGDRIAIAAYLGSGSSFDRSMARFARTYADLNERDHRALLDAIEDGRVEAQSGM